MEVDPKSQKHHYSLWGIPPVHVSTRIKKIMSDLRIEFGGPQFEPHLTMVGAISLTEGEALEMFRISSASLKPLPIIVDHVAFGTFFYQCVFLLLHPTQEVVELSSICCDHFGYKTSAPYMPHVSLIYGDLSIDEKKKAQELVDSIDEGINSICFEITRFQLWKTDTEDISLQSWEKFGEFCVEQEYDDSSNF